MKTLPALFLTLAALLPASALAQAAPDYALLGVAVRTRPAYDGSLSQKTDIIPVVRYFGQPWFVRTTQGILEGGARWNLGSGLGAGLQLAYEEGRDSSDSAFLRDHRFTDDVDPGASAGAHLEWDGKIGPAPVVALARYRQNLDSDRGAFLDLRVNVGVYGANRILAALYAEATWGSSKANNAFYGVTPAQSAASGFAVYEPGSGLKHVSAGVLGSYEMSRHWSLVGSLSQRWLQGDVAQSPLADCRQNTYGHVGVAYRF